MRYLSVCSGIEAASVAWHPLGWEPVGFSEIEPCPSAVLAHHYPHVPNFGDMTKFQEWPLDAGAIDLLVGGTPCQSFSVAGLRQGLKDPRGNLMLTYLAIAARLRPRWVVWENVPGVLSSSGGNDFASFLTGLGQLGYGFAYRVLDAQWCRTHGHSHAVPQRRRRVFVVGCLGNATAAAKVLFERESVQRHSKTRGAAREEVAADVEGRVGKCRNNPEQLVAGTLGAGDGNRGWRNDLDQGAFIPVPVMSMDEECNPGIEMIGPIIRGGGGGRHDCVAVPYTKAKRAQSDTDDETWVEGQVNPTLSLFDCGDVRATTVAIQAYSIREDAKANNFSATPTDVGLTVSALVPGVQSHHAQIFLAQAIPLDLRNSQRDPEKHDAQNRQGLGVGSVGDPAPTVDASFVHGVAQAVAFTDAGQGQRIRTVDESSETLRATKRGPFTDYYQAMTVRRLTPRECERLQGFPDDYTLIPWRKKAAGDCPDGPRYKALGNSMAVNCMAWIGERIAAVEAERGTT